MYVNIFFFLSLALSEEDYNSEHFNGNEFINIEIESEGDTRDFSKFFSWIVNSNKPDYKDASSTFLVDVTDLNQIQNPPRDKIQATWIGHSTLLVQFEGKNILTDPIFSVRCSPVKWAGPSRYTKAPFSVEDLPEIDFVVISHNHYDHLDLATIHSLGNSPIYFVPLGLKKWFAKAGVKKVVEMDWWEEHKIGVFTFVCTPTQHFSGRGLFDRNETLWCSWAVIGENKRFWFAGDTGYFSKFKNIGDKYGPFDLSAIPIGAYEPRWFMKPMHVNPDEAVQIHLDVKSKMTIGIHWGTFILTDEPIEEPREKLQESIISRKLIEREFIAINHGQTLIVE